LSARPRVEARETLNRGSSRPGPAVQKGLIDMAKSGSHYATVARIWRAGAVAAALTLGVTGLTSISFAQTQPAAPKKALEKAPAAAPKKDGAAGGAPQSAW